jgi:4-amino-4-deoxy-L-arabinose transferase-like glycosyltransferase
VLAGRFLVLDSLLTLFTTSCLLAGYIAVRGKQRRPAWWILSGIACAFGVLTKGPVALVLCAPPLVASGWLRADQSRTRFMHWFAFAIPLVVICVPWYVAVERFNPRFVDYFFWEHNLQRFMRGSNHEQPFWFYIPVIFAAMFPASLLLPSVAVFVISTARQTVELRSKDLGFVMCASVWIIAFFSAASCKLPTYILPAIPWISMAMGVMLDQTVFRSGAADRITIFLKPFPQRATAIMTIGCTIMIGVDTWLGSTVSRADVIAAIGIMVVFAILARNWSRDISYGRSAWAGTVAVGVGIVLFLSAVLMPTISSNRSMYVEARRISETDKIEMIVFFGEKPQASRFHLSSELMVTFPIEQVNEFVGYASRQQDFVLVTDKKHLESTRRQVAATHRLIASPHNKHVFRATRITEDSNAIASAGTVNTK